MPSFGNYSLRERTLFSLVALVLGLCAATASAAPADETDPVIKLLADKGLVGATTPTTNTDVNLPAPGAGIPNNGPAQKISLVDKVRDHASDMVLTAMNFLGVPYRRGGGSEATGFDCSGFTRHIFEMSVGLVLPRRADEQAAAKGLINIRRDELRPGDLVFFNTLRRTFSHVGIYVGEGKFIHSPSAGGKVRVEDMSIGYWTSRFTGARRVEASVSTDQAPAISNR